MTYTCPPGKAADNSRALLFCPSSIIRFIVWKRRRLPAIPVPTASSNSSRSNFRKKKKKPKKQKPSNPNSGIVPPFPSIHGRNPFVLLWQGESDWGRSSILGFLLRWYVSSSFVLFVGFIGFMGF